MVSLPELTGPQRTTQTEPPRGSHFTFGIWPKRQNLSVAGTNVSMGIVGQAAGIRETWRENWSAASKKERLAEQKNGVGVRILTAVRPGPALSCLWVLGATLYL